MGLLFAKFYNKNYDETKKTDMRTVPVFHGIEIHLLKAGERFQVPETDDIELYFNDTTSQIEITYNDKDNVRFSIENKNVNFMIVEGGESEDRTTINYPWSNKYNAFRIIQYTREEYVAVKKNVLERYMEYRD
jgi:hypothetical protein